MADEMKPPKKPGMGALVLSLGKSKSETEEPEESNGDFDDAAGELFEALKAGDKPGFAEALKACMHCK